MLKTKIRIMNRENEREREKKIESLCSVKIGNIIAIKFAINFF